MCMISMIGDQFRPPAWVPDAIPQFPQQPFVINFPEVTRQEFEALKHEVAELAKLLQAAKRYDEATGQPNCEQEEKLALLRRVAELVGVDLGI